MLQLVYIAVNLVSFLTVKIFQQLTKLPSAMQYVFIFGPPCRSVRVASLANAVGNCSGSGGDGRRLDAKFSTPKNSNPSRPGRQKIKLNGIPARQTDRHAIIL